jgi:uncharacterized membrane protein
VVPNDIDGLRWEKSRTERPKNVAGTGSVNKIVDWADLVASVALVAVTVTAWTLATKGGAV